jgi:hypothetical protein
MREFRLARIVDRPSAGKVLYATDSVALFRANPEGRFPRPEGLSRFC